MMSSFGTTDDIASFFNKKLNISRLQRSNRCGYTGHFLTWEIALLPRETAFSSVTDVSRGKFPVLNIHGDVKKITPVSYTHLTLPTKLEV